MRAQATNDFMVFGTVACTAFASGAIHVSAGWFTLNMLLLPALALALGLIAIQARRAAPARAA